MAYDFTAEASQSLTTATSPISAVPVTLAYWIYIPINGFLRSPVSIGAIGGNRCGFNVSTIGRISLAHIGSSTVSINQTASSSPTDTWIHVCGVFSSLSNRELFIDGVSQGTSQLAIASQGTFTSIAIGARYATTLGNFFTGRIADAGVWGVALTAAEVASLAKGFACSRVRPQSLAFYAPLVRDLVDASRGLAITNNNSATVENHLRIYY